MEFRIALCQTDIVWRAVADNLARIGEQVAAADADLVVLPELFATGFTTRPEEVVAEPEEGPVARQLRQWAVQYGKAVAGSVAVAEADGSRYNRMLFAEPSGRIVTGDKRHPFMPGGEERSFQPGRERVIAEYRGVRFLLTVCYDLRFPVWCRNRRNEYDVLLCVASWPASRRDAWQTLLRARAIENLSYAVGVNRIGSDPAARYAGDSAVIDFRGRTLLDAGAEAGCPVCTIDTEALARFRETFPAWRDADNFSLLP